MPDKKIEKVRKSDGRLVDFEEARIAESILVAARTVGVDDRYLATDLANVVTLYLERYHGQEVPEIRDIRDMVEKVLIETGHAAIARAFIRHREEAGRAAGTDAAVAVAEGLFPAEQLFVEASTRDEATAWGRQRIAEALVKEAGLERIAADEVAAAVEVKVFRSGFRRVTTSTIRHLVEHELFVRGLSGKLRRQAVIGVPKYDLDRLVQAGTDPARVCEALGETTLRQYALQDLFEGEVAAAHIDGAIHIAHLDHPIKLAWLAPSIEYVKRHGLRQPAPGIPELPDGARALTAQLRAVAAAVPRLAADAVELIHGETFYAPLVAALGPRELEAEAADFAALVAGRPGLASGAQMTLHLHVPQGLRRLRATGPNAARVDTRYGDLAAVSLRFARAALAVLRPVPAGARGTIAVALDASAFEVPEAAAALREACALAAATGDVLFCIDRGGDLSWPASRLGRFGPTPDGAPVPEEAWFAVAQAVFINLPRVAYPGAPGDLGGFYDRLDHAIDLAVRAHQQKQQALRRFFGESGTLGQSAGWSHEGRGAVRLADAVHLVVPVGLNEAVRHFAGRELGEGEDALKAAVRVLSCLKHGVQDAGRRAGLRIDLAEYPAGDAPERMARIDARQFAAARERGGEEGRPYTAAFHCRADAPLALSDRLAVESRFHTLFESGSVELPLPPGVARSAHEIFSLLQRACGETKAAQVHIV